MLLAKKIRILLYPPQRNRRDPTILLFLMQRGTENCFHSAKVLHHHRRSTLHKKVHEWRVVVVKTAFLKEQLEMSRWLACYYYYQCRAMQAAFNTRDRLPPDGRSLS